MGSHVKTAPVQRAAMPAARVAMDEHEQCGWGVGSRGQPVFTWQDLEDLEAAGALKSISVQCQRLDGGRLGLELNSCNVVLCAEQQAFPIRAGDMIVAVNGTLVHGSRLDEHLPATEDRLELRIMRPLCSPSRLKRRAPLKPSSSFLSGRRSAGVVAVA